MAKKDKKWECYEEMTEMSFEVSNLTCEYLEHKIKLFEELFGLKEDCLGVHISGTLRDEHGDYAFLEDDYRKVQTIRKDDYIMIKVADTAAWFEMAGIDSVKFFYVLGKGNL